MDKIKVENDLNYETSPLARYYDIKHDDYYSDFDNSILCYGTCCFSSNNHIQLGNFRLEINFMLDSSSDCVIGLFKFSLKKDDSFNRIGVIDFTVNNFEISDYNIEEVLDLVCKQPICRQPDSNLYGLQFEKVTIFRLCAHFHLLYDFTTSKLGFDGIPRYLWVQCWFECDASGGELHTRAYGFTSDWKLIKTPKLLEFGGSISYMKKFFNITLPDDLPNNIEFWIDMAKKATAFSIKDKCQDLDEYFEL